MSRSEVTCSSGVMKVQKDMSSTRIIDAPKPMHKIWTPGVISRLRRRWRVTLRWSKLYVDILVAVESGGKYLAVVGF